MVYHAIGNYQMKCMSCMFELVSIWSDQLRKAFGLVPKQTCKHTYKQDHEYMFKHIWKNVIKHKCQYIFKHIISRHTWKHTWKHMCINMFIALQRAKRAGGIPNLYRLVSAMKWGKSIISARKVPQFGRDLGANISHKNVSYDKKSYTTTNGMDWIFSPTLLFFSKTFF